MSENLNEQVQDELKNTADADAQSEQARETEKKAEDHEKKDILADAAKKNK